MKIINEPLTSIFTFDVYENFVDVFNCRRTSKPFRRFDVVHIFKRISTFASFGLSDLMILGWIALLIHGPICPLILVRSTSRSLIGYLRWFLVRATPWSLIGSFSWLLIGFKARFLTRWSVRFGRFWFWRRPHFPKNFDVCKFRSFGIDLPVDPCFDLSSLSGNLNLSDYTTRACLELMDSVVFLTFWQPFCWCRCQFFEIQKPFKLYTFQSGC